MSDRVQVLKTESTAGGGSDADAGPYGGPQPIDPNEDNVEARGYYLQDDSSDDESVHLSRDGDGKMTFRDELNTTPVVLAALVRRHRRLISEAEQDTAATSWQTAASTTGSAVDGGTYLIGWYSEIRIVGGNGGAVQARVLVDDVEQGRSMHLEAAYRDVAGFAYVDLAQGTEPALEVQFRRSGGPGDIAYIRRVRVKVKRVEVAS
jgi:hypothetical protein